MADAVISMVVARIEELLRKDAQFLFDVKDQVEEIQDELRRMKCFLKDAYEKQGTDAWVRHRIREVKSLAETIEDLVETYALKVASEKRLTRCFSKCVAVRTTGSEIARVRTKISNLTASLQSYGIASINEGESSRGNDAEQERWRRMSYPHMVDEDFVGMDDSVEKLVSLLVNGDWSPPRQVGPVSIWGMGGLGKTTVAKKFYNDDRVQRNFQRFAWICVTQVCETRHVLQDLLKQLLRGETREEIMGMGDQELVTQLYKVQEENKCLVVLDDIWKMDDWVCLRPAFPVEKEGIAGSRLLVTTRIKEVAEIGHVHELQCLNEDDGWKLLRKKAIPKIGDKDTEIEVDCEMEKAGRDMVQKCGGLPLAIVVLGGILKTKHTINDWNTVDRTIVSYLTTKGEGIRKGYVEQVLLLSYNNLPGYLKKCFLYLGEYPEDEKVLPYELYLKWIAGGVMCTDDQREGETMLEVAERYLEDLAQRSMVQVELRHTKMRFRDKNFRSCGLHDLMRDLCLAKANEEEFLRVIAIKSQGHELVIPNFTSVFGNINPRRLVIFCYEMTVAHDLELALGSIDRKQIRSFSLTASSHHIQYPYLKFPLSIGKCTMLRYLQLEGIKFSNGMLPKQITRLVHLRHLDLRLCILKELPASIGNLCYLQILTLITNYNQELIIPNVFWKLRQLMSIYLPKCTRVKKGQKLRLDGLTKLENLEGVNTCHFNVKDVAKLANLRFIEIQICGTSTFGDVAWFINYLNTDTSHHIGDVGLSFENCNFHSEEGQSILQIVFQCSARLYWSVSNSMLPKLILDESHSSYNNLNRIYVVRSKFEEDPFHILEKLPNLQVLELSAIDFPGKEMVCTSSGFPQLLILDLLHLINLEVWKMDEGALPNLAGLKIGDCINLKMLPDELRCLSGLKRVEILYMPQEFKNRVGVVNGIQGEDFDKISQVRELIIHG